MRKWPAASEYHPTPEAARIATERTHDILKAWGMRINAWDTVDFGVLVRSAYLQGVEDAGMAMSMRGMLKVPRVEGSYEEER